MTDAGDPDLPRAPEGRPELSVIVPCLNEELNLPELADRVLGAFDRAGLAGELVVVDDGSTDRTAEVLRGLEEEHPGRVVGVYHPRNRGIAAAWRSGADASRGRLVATIDADLQYQPEDLLRLRRALYEHSVDVVQGYRSPTGRRRDERYTLSRGFNALLNGVFSMHLRDNKSGFVMCAREVFLDLLSHRSNYYYWQSFIMVAAHAKGYSYREVETLFEERRQGTSFLAGSNALRASARSFVDLAKATWEYRLTSPPRSEEAGARRPPDPSSEVRFRAYVAAIGATQEMITRDVVTHREALARTEWLARERLDVLVDEKLRRLVRHAYREVPFHRARMRALGLHPDDIRGVDDLAKLPVLDKRDVRQHLYFDILSENHDKDQVLRITTCGARGEPMVTFADRAQLELRFAAKLRAAEWTGYRFGDRAARLIDRDTRDWLRRSRRMILEAKLARRKLAWSIPSPSVLERLRSSEAVLLEGDSEVLELLARLAAATGRAPAIPAILAGGQDLSDGVRRQIETVFGARVFDTYETRELGLVAHECEARQGLHVVSDGYLVEVLVGDRAAAPYEVGDLVVTVLDGFCLPFLRYRTGDRAMLLPREPLCPCGRASPRIAAIEGRRRSALVGPRSAVPGTDVARLVRSYEHAIRRYQVVQDGVDRVRFRYAKAGRFSDRDLDQILATLRLILPDVRLEAETLPDDEIVRDAVVTSLFVDFDASGALVVRDGPPPPARVG